MSQQQLLGEALCVSIICCRRVLRPRITTEGRAVEARWHCPCCGSRYEQPLGVINSYEAVPAAQEA